MWPWSVRAVTRAVGEGQEGVSMPCSAAQSRPGGRSAKTRTMSAASEPRPAARTRARRLLPAPLTPTAIRPRPRRDAHPRGAGAVLFAP
jgi:hypothetical protein